MRLPVEVTGSGAGPYVFTASPLMVFNQTYHVRIDSGAYRDAAGNDFAGLNTGSFWNFTTGEGGSCAAIKAALPSSTDGTYTIDPDGAGGISPFSVYCDMTTDGGGWTLMARIISGGVGHNVTGAVGSLTSPTQTTVAKLSDSVINAIPKTHFRLRNNGQTGFTYFKLLGSYATVTGLSNCATDTYTKALADNFVCGLSNTVHVGLNPIAQANGCFNTPSYSTCRVYGGTGGRDGMYDPAEGSWFGAGTSGTAWIK